MATEPSNTLALVQQLSRSAYRQLSVATTVDMKELITLSHLREIGPVTQQTLSEILCIDRNNTVITLNELEQKGLISRRRDPADRRRHIVEVTDYGLSSLHETERAMRGVAEEQFAALTEQQREQLHDLLHLTLHGDGGVLQRLRGATPTVA